ncbi:MULTISPECIES: hypothetical protein [unclassified Pseudomonas]|uniref:hypothetical protein n=1 Tax=unclassified Pseudomonas TaxID=196821 RepID=UPI00111289C0|nr:MULTISPECIES: hypothetical protein [unclassified Pseudomonas]
MSRLPRVILSGGFLLVVGMILGVLGLCSAFFGFGVVGAGVSGSGCGDACSKASDFLISLSRYFLGVAILSALLSIRMTWKKSSAVGQRGVKIVMTILNTLVILISGLVFALLMAIFYEEYKMRRLQEYLKVSLVYMPEVKNPSAGELESVLIRFSLHSQPNLLMLPQTNCRCETVS